MNDTQKIKSLYAQYVADQYGEMEIDYIVEIVKNNPQEIATLIELFDQEKNIDYKMALASALAELQNKHIVTFLEGLLHDKYKKYSAAYYLVLLNQKIGSKAFLRFSQESDPEFSSIELLHFLVGRLNSINNDLARETILEITGGKTADEFYRTNR